MHRYEVALAEKEIDVLRLEEVLARFEVDAVEDQVEIVAVGLDLGMMGFGKGVLHRQLVEVEDIREHLDFFGRGVDQVYPDPGALSGVSHAGSTASTCRVAPPSLTKTLINPRP